MPSSPFFSGRIPQELLDKVEEHRALTGESKTDVLVRSLAKYVGHELPEVEVVEPPIRSQIDEILKRLEVVEIELKTKKLQQQTLQESNETQLTLLDNKEITNDNDLENTRILATKEAVETVGISQGTLSQWKTKRLLPQEKNGYRIDFERSTKVPRQSYWKVTKI